MPRRRNQQRARGGCTREDTVPRPERGVCLGRRALRALERFLRWSPTDYPKKPSSTSAVAAASASWKRFSRIASTGVS